MNSTELDVASLPPQHPPTHPHPSGCCCYDNLSRKLARAPSFWSRKSGAVLVLPQKTPEGLLPDPRPVPAPAPSSAPFLNSLPHPPHLPPLTHPWHPNWLKVAASPLLGLLLPLLLHLPLLPKQLLLLPPFPSVTPWLQPRDGKRPGGGRAGSPRNDELRVATAWGREGRVGSGRVPVLSAPPFSPKGRSCGGHEGGRPSRSRVWSGSAAERPPAPGCAGVWVCTPGQGRRGFRPSSGKGALSGC